MQEPYVARCIILNSARTLIVATPSYNGLCTTAACSRATTLNPISLTYDPM